MAKFSSLRLKEEHDPDTGEERWLIVVPPGLLLESAEEGCGGLLPQL